MAKINRHDFTESTKRLLKDRAGSLCSNPDCQVMTIGANENKNKNKTTNVGVAAHITAAAPGGPRFNESLTPKERKSADNGIWLCQTHAKEIDDDELRFPVELLRQWKAQAEAYAQQHVGKNLGSQQARLQPTALTQPPLYPDLFLGRDDDIKQVKDTLFNGESLLLLVNGEGGIGKTTLASRYYHQYQQHYTHLAWVFAEADIAAALLTLANPLKVQFAPTATIAERLNQLITAMAALPAPCLLVIDNANSIENLEQHYNSLRRCSNFHILITTRVTEFEQAPKHAIGQLSKKHAKALFTSHYPALKADEELLLEDIFSAIGYNTLVIELLAKNLKLLNRVRSKYSLSELLEDLQTKGLLGLSHSKAVGTDYHAGSNQLRKEQPQDIIAAMYDLGDYDENHQKLLSIFALLPAEHISFDTLEDLQVLGDSEVLEQTLLSLYQQGWLEFEQDNSSFRTSPVIQAVVRGQNKEYLNAHSEALINQLIDKLDYQTGTGHLIHINYNTANLYCNYSRNIFTFINVNIYDHSVLLERLANFERNTGNLNTALIFYSKTTNLVKQLQQQQPQNIDLKHGLAVAYERLGDTHTSLGNLDIALSFYNKEIDLFVQLQQRQPHNLSFTNGLAIAFEKLGSTHVSLGDLNKALELYKKGKNLSKQLHQKQPENTSFKYGLTIAYSKLGDTYTSLGDLNKALLFFNQRAELSKQLHQQEPQNINFTKGLAVAYSKLGQTHTYLGDLDKALTFYNRDANLSKQLHQQHPQNINFKHSLAIAYQKLGETHTGLGDLYKAHSFYKKNTYVSIQLLQQQPQNINFKLSLAIAYEKLGDTNIYLGDLNEALTFYNKEIDFFEQLHQQQQQNTRFTNGLAIAYCKLGEFYQQPNSDYYDLNKTIDYFSQAQELWLQLTSTAPAFVEFRNNLEWVENVLREIEGGE